MKDQIPMKSLIVPRLFVDPNMKNIIKYQIS